MNTFRVSLLSTMQLRPGILNQTENTRISNRVGLCFFIVLFWSLSLRGEVYKELVPDFDRRESRVTIRRIQNPTLADLGYAAYVANPIRYDPESFSPEVDDSYSIDEMTFDSSLSEIADSIGETPLSSEEMDSPLAWEPLQEEIWKNYQFDGMKRLGGSIESEKWGDASVFKPFQEIAAVFIHETGEVYPEIWAEIEFKEWVDFLEEDITDSDGDGFREIYGRLNTQKLEGDEEYSKVLDWIKNVYTAEVLKWEEILDWFNVLASYWYPTYNTDVMDLSNVDVWPDETTEPGVREELAGVEVEDPDVIIKGVPYGKAVYNVFIIPGMGKESDTGEVTTGLSTEQNLDTLLSDNFVNNNKRFKKELTENGGAYKNWYESLGSFIQAEKSILNRLNDEHPGFEGRKGWLFFRKSLEYTTAGDLREQSKEKNPYKHILEFNNWLENQGIDMLFVPVPLKVEIYPEMIGKDVPDVSGKIVQPYLRKFLRDLQKAGVEVIDLLPAFLKGAQSSDSTIYQKQDTHWNDRGLQIAADLISDRIKEYSWYNEAEKTEYIREKVKFRRQGDIVSRIPDSLQSDYPPAELTGHRVLKSDTTPYKREPNAEILLIGDSFTGVFELTDCKSAGIGSNIVYKTGLPVDMVTSWGGGPLVRGKMIRTRKKYLGNKRVVIYLMVDRDLYNYSQGWKSLEEIDE